MASEVLLPHSALLLLRNIATIAVFYALPVVQLVITYQTVRAWGWSPKDFSPLESATHLTSLNISFFICKSGLLSQ